ncbi:N-acetyltransferase [Fructobacillus sp. M158]|nr:GNAT family N-acetyltransferase [Fructobacillus parabroussonetiae]MCK8617937.1 N-acetyltransferase [Fructobacillus parabroussonetiae]
MFHIELDSIIIRHHWLFKKEEAMAIQQKGNRFIYEVNGQVIGEAVFLPTEDQRVLALTKTFVEPAFRGQTIAQDLVDAVCDFARSKGAKVRPDCRYAAVLFRRFEEKYADVAVQDGPEANSCSI